MKHHLTLLVCTLVSASPFEPALAQTFYAQNGALAANPTVADPQNLVQDLTTSDPFIPAPARAGAQALALLRENAPDKDLAGIEDDLRIMGRILRKAANGGDAYHRNAMGIVVHRSAGGDSAPPRELYLEGYGALFFLNADFPLLAPAAKPSETEAKDDTSSEWEEARRELQHPQNRFFAGDTAPDYVTMPGSSLEPYDADKVATLKTGLITALKNAAHLRRLKADETITVVVAGHGGNVSGNVVMRTNNGGGSFGIAGMGGGGGGFTGSAMPGMMGSVARQTGEGRGGLLILRVRKSDAEAFQKGKLSAADFREKVSALLR